MIHDAGEKLKPDQELISLSWKKGKENKRGQIEGTDVCSLSQARWSQEHV